ncbi:ribonuclease H-like domain-containing protein [Mycena albidolilacea]|uniref:Ribonuclease H-like domain-containing protein n=1 Tax=Mycena albidolilacea TaxID=1033008 RepID=A0AAD7EZ34_9AGAR|nr:ribonuclease H-like domain-containing protein [Mycena albidolilacea]
MSQRNTRQAMGNGANGVWTGTRFTPPANQTPQSLFPVGYLLTNNRQQFARFCAPTSGRRTMCIYTDGACINNGSTDPAAVPRAGCGFVFNNTPGGNVSLPLEAKGPDGVAYTPTSNRAELRAVIGALEFRSWSGEGWQRVVIATDMDAYVGEPGVLNRDLWELLSEKMGVLAEDGCEVSFWAVPREWNQAADRAASLGVNMERYDSYMRLFGAMV